MKDNEPMKHLTLFLAPLLLLSLGGCSSGPSVTPMDFGRLQPKDYAASDIENMLTPLLYADLTSKVNNKENFALLVYEQNNSCTCWKAGLAPTLKHYLSNNDFLLYAIDYRLFSGQSSSFGLTLDASHETLAIFDDGVISEQKTSGGTDDSWATDFDTFATWMNARVTSSSMLYVTKSDLDGLFAGTDEFTLGFLRSSCGDCSYLSHDFLEGYNHETKQKLSYVIDCDQKGIRYNDAGEKDIDQWNSFKVRYGLAESSDPDFGYGEGYVPTFLHYNPAFFSKTQDSSKEADAVTDGAVAYNDTVTTTEGKSTVSDSYYTEERVAKLAFLTDVEIPTGKVLKGLALPVDAVDGNGYWKHSEASKYHNPLIKAFLDYYVKP